MHLYTSQYTPIHHHISMYNTIKTSLHHHTAMSTTIYYAPLHLTIHLPLLNITIDTSTHDHCIQVYGYVQGFKVLYRGVWWCIEVYGDVYRGYYTVARRYEFYFRVAKQYFTNERSEWVKYCFCHEKIEFISSSRRVMFFLLYRQNDIDKIIQWNYQKYVIDKLMCEIRENKPLGSRM